MKYGVYSIRDQLVGFGLLKLAPNDEAAERDFMIMVNDPSGTLLSVQPQYFDFYKVGEFDSDTGELKPIKDKQLLVTGLSVKKGDMNAEADKD